MTEGLGSGAYFIDREAARTVAMLNQAIELDREAMATLLRTRVSVNRQFAEQSEVGVAESDNGYTVSVLGLVNAVLRVNGLNMLTACMSQDGCNLRLDGIISHVPIVRG